MKPKPCKLLPSFPDSMALAVTLTLVLEIAIGMYDHLQRI